ncbi:MAG: hypothetical protein HY812_00945 [Planctomycetes bacterium]|nr:hypothetical protein [Planctomycetota bacterium]
MSGHKKHPLEVFKASGRPLGEHMPPAAERAEKRPEPPPPKAAGQSPFADFELRLTLPGGLVVLFVWIVLMGAAYMYGHSRGRDAEHDAVGSAALAKGRQIEEGAARPDEAAGNAPPEESSFPYGVLLITYDKAQEKQIGDLKRILRERYQIEDKLILPWKDPTTGMIEVYAGVFERRDDPALLQLEARLRAIDDYPMGGKRPFATAMIKMHPADPRKAARSGN